ncbi:MAG: PARP-type zinc finger-containing protein [Candidatus Thorarchaeota archaeon]
MYTSVYNVVVKVLNNSLRQTNANQEGMHQKNERNVSWVEIEAEWAFWIDPESFNLKRLKKRAPIGAIIIIKTRKKLDDERTYVDDSFGLVIEEGIDDLTKREASDILAKQAVEYMRWSKHWPASMEIREIQKSGDVKVGFKPSEYDSFVLLITRNIVGANPDEFLSKLKKHETPQEPSWRVETAKSGRSRCRSCRDYIFEGRFRIGEPYLYEGSLSYRWYHPRCVTRRIDVNDIESLDGYSKLRPVEKQRLKHLLTQ